MAQPYEIISGNNNSLIISQTTISVQPGGNDNIFGFNGGAGGEAPYDLRDKCQTFTVLEDCVISQIKVNIGCGSYTPELLLGQIVMTLRTTDINGHPTNTILGTSILNLSNLSAVSQSTQTFSFNNIRVYNNQKYAIVIHLIFDEEDNVGIGFGGTNLGEVDHYAGGEVLYQLSTGAWDIIDPENEAHGYHPEGGYRDMWFKVYKFLSKNDAKLYTEFDDDENKLIFTVEKPGYIKSTELNLS